MGGEGAETEKGGERGGKWQGEEGRGMRELGVPPDRVCARTAECATEHRVEAHAAGWTSGALNFSTGCQATTAQNRTGMLRCGCFGLAYR